jgi:hypothetical protein
MYRIRLIWTISNKGPKNEFSTFISASKTRGIISRSDGTKAKYCESTAA